MGFSMDFGDSCRSSHSHPVNNQEFIPKDLIINFIVKLLNLRSNDNVLFERGIKTGTFIVKSDLDVLNVVVKKLQLELWKKDHFETHVTCKADQINSLHLNSENQAKAKIEYKKIEIENLRNEKSTTLKDIRSIMSKYYIDASELNIEFRESVKTL